MKQRRLLAGMIYVAIMNSAHAGVSAELMLGNQSSTFDTKYSGELASKTPQHLNIMKI